MIEKLLRPLMPAIKRWLDEAWEKNGGGFTLCGYRIEFMLSEGQAKLVDCQIQKL